MFNTKKFEEMSLEEKIGHTIVTYIHSGSDMKEVQRSRANPDNLRQNKIKLKDIASNGLLGGIFFVWDNFKNIDEMIDFIRSIQSNVSYPLLLMADMESGVSSMVSEATDFPFNMGIGAAHSKELTFEYGKVVASEAMAIGLNMITCPVVDVNIDPRNPMVNVRSYGDDPELVANMGKAFIEGCQNNGLLACAKHFPGSGDMPVDSHRELPVVNRSEDELKRIDLLPYRVAIASDVGSIMTTHIVYPSLDSTPNLPATLSEPILNGLLRKEMGFERVIISDAMVMDAISQNFGMKESFIRAFNAGCDLLLVNEPEKALQYVYEGIKEGQITEARLNASVKRILKAKEWVLNKGYAVPDQETAKKKVGSEQNGKVALELARKSVTLFEGNFPEVSQKKIMVIDTEYRWGPSWGAPPQDVTSLIKQFAEKEITVKKIDKSYTSNDVEQITKEMEEFGIVVFLLHTRVTAYHPENVVIPDSYVDFVDTVINPGKPFIIVSLGSPYILKKFKSGITKLCTFSDSVPSVRALIELLEGKQQPEGKASVSL